ncbi:glutathione S-transferase A4-like [Ptychodera flava]|uniref:glutathione S-transferase A4-like n=1 Tax=Ptychodera flava TaxID=63121 RepID=UPI003969C4C7
MADDSKANLVYFNGRGCGEGTRIIMAAAGIEFTETFVTTNEQLEKYRKDGDLLFMQIPMLEIDGMKIVQSQAIIRYIAKKHGLAGATPQENLRVDILNEGAREFLWDFILIGFTSNDEEHYEKIKTQTFPRYLPIYEKILAESTSGYLVGDVLTVADLTLLEALLSADDYLPGSLDGYPKVQEFKNKISSLPRIEAYLQGPQRKPKNSPEYVTECYRIRGLIQ